MIGWSRTLSDPFSQPATLARARYGVIEMVEGRLAAIHVRAWPKIISTLEIAWLGRRWHERRLGDRCLIYYNQPRRHPNFLVLKYTVSNRGTTLATFQRGLAVLDELARLKHSDAILCDVCNLRISERLLARWGWEPHRPSRWHRHYIKRFWGVYPPPRSDLFEGCPLATAASDPGQIELVGKGG